MAGVGGASTAVSQLPAAAPRTTPRSGRDERRQQRSREGETVLSGIHISIFFSTYRIHAFESCNKVSVPRHRHS